MTTASLTPPAWSRLASRPARQYTEPPHGGARRRESIAGAQPASRFASSSLHANVLKSGAFLRDRESPPQSTVSAPAASSVEGLVVRRYIPHRPSHTHTACTSARHQAARHDADLRREPSLRPRQGTAQRCPAPPRCPLSSSRPATRNRTFPRRGLFLCPPPTQESSLWASD